MSFETMETAATVTLEFETSFTTFADFLSVFLSVFGSIFLFEGFFDLLVALFGGNFWFDTSSTDLFPAFSASDILSDAFLASSDEAFSASGDLRFGRSRFALAPFMSGASSGTVTVTVRSTSVFSGTFIESVGGSSAFVLLNFLFDASVTRSLVTFSAFDGLSDASLAFSD